MAEEAKPGKISKADRLKYLKVIWWLRKHPVHAVWIIFGLKLSPHQRITFKKMWFSKTVGLKLSRGLSKTFLDGLYLVLRGMLYKNATQIVLTRGFRGGKMVLRESCQEIINSQLNSQKNKQYAIRCLENYRKTAKSYSIRVINKDPDMWTIRFAHGSNIQTGPLGKDVQKTSQLRGLRANTTLILDEAADIGDELYQSVIRPFARVGTDPVSGANEIKEDETITRIESGTIKYDWQRYTRELDTIEKKSRSGDSAFSLLEFNYEDCFHWINNARPDNFIEDIRKYIRSKKVNFTYKLNLEDIFNEISSGATSWEDFLSENKNKIQISEGTEFASHLLEMISNAEVDSKYLDSFGDEESIFFDPEKLDRTLFPLLKSEDPCILGIDPARESDDAAFVLVRIGPFRKCRAPFCDVINAKTFNQTEFKDLYFVIRQYLNDFPNIKKIIMDVGGGGYALRDMLWRPPDGLTPIYDPNDENTPEEVRAYGMPLLQMDQSTNEKNTVRVNFLKGQMQAMKYLIPPFIYFTGNRDIDEQYRNTRRLKQQYSYIVSTPSGNFKRYFVEGKYKKDLFSASLLAMQGVYDALYNKKEVVENIFDYV